MQLQAALYIDGRLPGLANNTQGAKPIKGLCQRLKGKQGRFRGNLSGSVWVSLGGQLSLSIEQAAVPMLVAKNLTYLEIQ